MNETMLITGGGRGIGAATARLAARHGYAVALGYVPASYARVRQCAGCRRRGGAGGRIVNVSSAAVKHGAGGEYVDYAASKAAIDTFTLGLAREVAAEGIRVNAVRPGIIDTEIHAAGGNPDRARQAAPSLPMRRAGTADEVAAAILWLASAEASYCTGAILDVAGGR